VTNFSTCQIADFKHFKRWNRPGGGSAIRLSPAEHFPMAVEPGVLSPVPRRPGGNSASPSPRLPLHDKEGSSLILPPAPECCLESGGVPEDIDNGLITWYLSDHFSHKILAFSSGSDHRFVQAHGASEHSLGSTSSSIPFIDGPSRHGTPGLVNRGERARHVTTPERTESSSSCSTLAEDMQLNSHHEKNNGLYVPPRPRHASSSSSVTLCRSGPRDQLEDFGESQCHFDGRLSSESMDPDYEEMGMHPHMQDMLMLEGSSSLCQQPKLSEKRNAIRALLLTFPELVSSHTASSA